MTDAVARAADVGATVIDTGTGIGIGIGIGHEANDEITLADIAGCYEGGVPAVICTADDAGVPNITYLSRVHQVDRDRIAISNQFMSKTSRNIAVNPVADLLLINPQTYEEFRLSIRYERTERRGPVFERLRDDVESLAEVLGLQGVFRLRAADIHRVTAIERVGRAHPPVAQPDQPARSLSALAELTERLQRAPDLDYLIEVAIRGIDEVLGYHHVAMLLLDESGRVLYTIASRGFDEQNIGAEVVLGEGPVGGPLGRCALHRSTGLRQLSKYGRTVRSSFVASGVRPGHDVPLPTLSDVDSRVVVPLRSLGQLVGGIVVERRSPGTFTVDDEHCLTVAAGVIASALEQARGLDVLDGQDATIEPADRGRQHVPPRADRQDGDARTIVRFFEVDGSVFVGGEYLIKGVAGRILRSLVAEHLASGRTDFTNRELRLDRTLDLPGFKDNLESRLLLLKRRLDERDVPLRIDKTGRGRFALDVRARLALETVDTVPV